MIPKEFDYVAPGTLDEAISALAGGGDDAKALAGGHSLIPAMKLRLSSPTLLVDLGRIKELREARDVNGSVEVGSMVTYHELRRDQDKPAGSPLLGEAAFSIGDAQVRARGTIGGSLAHADPAADMPAAVLALNATIITNR